MRTFIGLPFASIMQQKIDDFAAEVQKSLPQDGVKFVTPETLHITLKFIGKTDSEQLEQIRETMDLIAAQYSNISIVTTELGMLSQRNNPKVVWLGLNASDDLVEMQKNLESSLEKYDIPREKRKYNPHITLARVKKSFSEDSFKTALNEHKFSRQEVLFPEIVLYESILEKSGPIYKPIHTAKIKS